MGWTCLDEPAVPKAVWRKPVLKPPAVFSVAHLELVEKIPVI
jgi:hypothetical protein